MMQRKASVIFKTNNALRDVVNEAKEYGCKILFVKDNGVYLMSEKGSMTPDNKKRAHIAYAQGLNPDKDEFEDWYEKSRYLCGGDDFSQPLPIENFQYAIDVGRSVKIRIDSDSMTMTV